jgi:hypothetical protein
MPRTSALPFYSEMPNRLRAKARAALRREIGMDIENGNADAVIEQVWNALVGHDQIEPEKPIRKRKR